MSRRPRTLDAALAKVREMGLQVDLSEVALHMRMEQMLCVSAPERLALLSFEQPPAVLHIDELFRSSDTGPIQASFCDEHLLVDPETWKALEVVVADRTVRNHPVQCTVHHIEEKF